MRSDEVRKNALGEPDDEDVESEDQLELEEALKDGEYNAANIDVSNAANSRSVATKCGGVRREHHGTKKSC